MALDPIWQQQLTLVSYGNEYLKGHFNFSHWLEHAIFNQHQFYFRDLLTQQLLAQHFQPWLEGLKAQGVTHLSLHSSQLLNEEKNPNSQVELVPYAHFIVSHAPKQLHAWIFGQELAAWYTLEHNYVVPAAQALDVRLETLWRFELNSKLIKRIQTDLQRPDWDQIEQFIQTELFSLPLVQAWSAPESVDLPYTGQPTTDMGTRLALLPTDYAADYAHQSLHRLASLSQYITKQQQHAQHADGRTFSAEDHLQYRHFGKKLDDLFSKFIVKVANHYQTAHLTPAVASAEAVDLPTKKQSNTKNVLALIIVTALLCTLAYYIDL